MTKYFDSENALIMDVLKEIGNIGAGNAATSLANMINKKIDMTVPKVSVLDFQDVPVLMGGEEIPVCGIIFELTGDMNGTIMFILSLDSAKRLVDLMMPGLIGEEIDEMALSAIKEVGNILSGSYITSLSGLTNLKINMSIPLVSIDMAGAILSVPVVQFGLVGDKILIIENDFFEDSEKEAVQGYFFLIPDVDSYGTLFGSLGINV